MCTSTLIEGAHPSEALPKGVEPWPQGAPQRPLALGYCLVFNKYTGKMVLRSTTTISASDPHVWRTKSIFALTSERLANGKTPAEHSVHSSLYPTVQPSHSSDCSHFPVYLFAHVLSCCHIVTCPKIRTSSQPRNSFHLIQGCQNHDYIIQFNDFMIQTYPCDSIILVSRIYVLPS